MKIIIYIAMLVVCIAGVISAVLHLRFMYPYIAALMPILSIFYAVIVIIEYKKNKSSKKGRIENSK
jgi:hypothetical protein